MGEEVELSREISDDIARATLLEDLRERKDVVYKFINRKQKQFRLEILAVILYKFLQGKYGSTATEPPAFVMKEGRNQLLHQIYSLTLDECTDYDMQDFVFFMMLAVSHDFVAWLREQDKRTKAKLHKMYARKRKRTEEREQDEEERLLNQFMLPYDKSTTSTAPVQKLVDYRYKEEIDLEIQNPKKFVGFLEKVLQENLVMQLMNDKSYNSLPGLMNMIRADYVTHVGFYVPDATNGDLDRAHRELEAAVARSIK